MTRALVSIVMALLLSACGTATTPVPVPGATQLPSASPAASSQPATATVPPARPSVVTPAAPTAVPTNIAAAPTALPTSARSAAWAPITASGPAPTPRFDHSVLVDPVRNTLVVFGGRGNGDYGDTWVFDLAARTWREVKGAAPEARFGHAVVYDAASRRMLLVMGQGETFYNDAWAFDLDKETWAKLSANSAGDNKPRPRYGQSAVLDARGRIVVSHGFSDQGRFDDTWAFDLKSNQWVNLTPASGAKPLKRCLHELVYDPAGDRVILFGGCSSGFGPCPQGDLWAFDLKANTWSELTPDGAKPSARDNPALAYDPASKRIILFGGRVEGGVSAETWLYDLAANRWTPVQGAGPAARRSHESDFDARGGRLLVFGGTADAPKNDIWEWK